VLWQLTVEETADILDSHELSCLKPTMQLHRADQMLYVSLPQLVPFVEWVFACFGRQSLHCLDLLLDRLLGRIEHFCGNG